MSTASPPFCQDSARIWAKSFFGGVVAWLNQLNVSAAHELAGLLREYQIDGAHPCQPVNFAKYLHNSFLRHIKLASIRADHLADIQIYSIKLDRRQISHISVLPVNGNLWSTHHTHTHTCWQLKNLAVQKVC